MELTPLVIALITGAIVGFVFAILAPLTRGDPHLPREAGVFLFVAILGGGLGYELVGRLVGPLDTWLVVVVAAISAWVFIKVAALVTTPHDAFVQVHCTASYREEEDRRSRGFEAPHQWPYRVAVHRFGSVHWLIDSPPTIDGRQVARVAVVFDKRYDDLISRILRRKTPYFPFGEDVQRIETNMVPNPHFVSTGRRSEPQEGPRLYGNIVLSPVVGRGSGGYSIEVLDGAREIITRIDPGMDIPKKG